MHLQGKVALVTGAARRSGRSIAVALARRGVKLVLHCRTSRREAGQPMVLLEGNPTTDAIARHIFDYCQGQKLPVASVRVWETQSSNAMYRECE